MALACTAILPASAGAADQKTNIAFIMLDEWGYYEMSGLGHPRIQTPNIDRLFLDGGMRFTQALAGAPVCGPTSPGAKASRATPMRAPTRR